MSSLPAHLQAGVKAQGDFRVSISQFLVVTGSRRSGENNNNKFSCPFYTARTKKETLSSSAAFKIDNCGIKELKIHFQF
jgi:hypothetical protein